jgi:hypothetical protein
MQAHYITEKWETAGLRLSVTALKIEEKGYVILNLSEESQYLAMRYYQLVRGVRLRRTPLLLILMSTKKFHMVDIK